MLIPLFIMTCSASQPFQEARLLKQCRNVADRRVLTPAFRSPA
jgi:hypothetical protein